jgi:RHS repeat-associated protein
MICEGCRTYITYTGKERDAETGLDYFGARYMSAAQGRFTSPDPYMPSADVKDPQSWNRYVYTRNNPLRFVDPNGLDWKDLSEEQRRVFQTYADNYNKTNESSRSSEEIYNTLNESQMATLESVTYALEHTNVSGGGNALQQVAGVTGIAGEVKGESGDKQFRLFAELTPGAIDKISKTGGFEYSSNVKLGFIQLYHKGFPYSYRQNTLPSLQPSYSKGNILLDSLRSDIDIDYEPHSSPAHLQPANSDVRAPGHYQQFIDKWPGLRNWWDKKK